MITWRVSLRTAAALALYALAAASPAKTLRTIAVDGDLSDWTGVLLDRDQKIADRSLAQGDPDVPSQSQRDERGIAFTWDATNLYLYFSRSGSGTNSFNAIFYIDVGHDGMLAGTSDKVALFKMTGSNFSGFELDRYDDGGTPDPVTGDGVSEAGALGVQISSTGGNAAADANGIAFEASITWGTLGLAAGTPLFIHPAISSNSNLPGGIQDNADRLDTLLPAVMITAGATKGCGPGRVVDFPHRVTNDGTATDFLDLSVRTRLGFAVSVYSDPNGDGNPADGVLLQRDGNGDGDTTDAGDTPPSGANDGNGNRILDAGSLAAGASRSYVLRATVPASQPPGTEELLQPIVASGYRPAVRANATDAIEVGLLTVTPPRSIPSSAGQGVRLWHLACNASGVARVVDMTFTSSSGWSGSFRTDPNGDGDPTDGAALTDTDGDTLPDLGTLADAQCVTLVLTVNVPAGASPGAIDTVNVVASDGAVSSTVADSVDVTSSLVDVRPDRTAKGQRGKTLYLVHEVRNASASSATYALAVNSTLGSQVAAMDDPDGDGTPDTSSVVTTTGVLQGSGGRFPEITRIRIPVTAVHGNTDLVDTTASSSSPAAADSARDTIGVVGTLTYSDALFGRPASEFFGQCSMVYVLAYRSGGGTYRFAWYDPASALQRASADLTPYADGSLDDFFDCGAGPTLGTWTVKLQSKSGGGTYSDVGPSGTTTFALQDLVAGGASVTLNDTGSDLYALSGDVFSAFADLANPTSADVLGSRVEHVAWYDADGSGAPTAGEDYLRSDGTTGTWASGSVTSSRAGVDLYAGENWSDSFSTPAATFSRSGAWKLQSKWIASCGVLLSTRTATFTVGCQPAPVFGGVTSAGDEAACAYSGIRLGWSAATSWGLGSGGTYAVYRSTTPGFTPDATTLVASGLTGTTWLDTGAAPDTAYDYVVRAESDVTCSDGPNNSGLMDANFAHASATDADAGVVPVASFGSDDPQCLDAGSATVTFTDTSTGPPASWDWDFDGDGLTDATTPTATHAFTAAGAHSVFLRVGNACGSGTVTRTVTIGAPPTAVVTASASETCAGTPVDLDGSGSTASGAATLTGYAWDFESDGVVDSTAAHPGAVSWPAAGAPMVKLTVTDSLGCTQATSFAMQVNGALTVSLGAPSVDQCTGASSVTATPSGGRAPYAFSWDVLTDDGSGRGSATFASGSRTATVTVTDAGGCTAQATSAPIVVSPRLGVSLGAPTIDACTGLVTIRATASGGDGAYAFSWTRLADDGAGLGSATLASSSTPETVTVTDGAGCTAQATSAPIVVSPRLGVSLGAPTIDACTGLVTIRATASGGDGAYAFSWTRLADDGAGLGSATLASSSTPETVTVTDGAGCTAQATSAPIVVSSRLGVSLGAPSVDQCTGRVTIRATASGGDGAYAFSWTRLADDGAGLGSATLASSSTPETVTVTDGAGCTAQATSAPIVVSPRLGVSLGAPTIDACTGRVTIRATASGGDGAYAFSWTRLTDDGAGLGSATFASSSTPETVTVTDGAGCTAQATSAPIVVSPRLGVSLGTPTIDACTGLVTIRATASGGDGAYAFSWTRLTDDGAGLGSATLASSSTPETVTVTDGAGCTAQATSGAIVVSPRLSVSLGAPVIDACTGRVTIRATATGGSGAYAFAWTRLTDDGTGLGSAVLPPGSSSETVTVTDGAGCTAQATVPVQVVTAVQGGFAWSVAYVGPGDFRADMTASTTAGTAPFTFSWDAGADGIEDGTGPAFAMAMAPGSTVPVRLTITDANGCASVAQQDVTAGGCAVDTAARLLMVRRDGAGLAMTWEPSTHACHARYEMLEAATARPAAGAGAFPSDPAWSSLSAEDADGSDANEQVLLADPRAGSNRYFLVRDGGTDGSWGPVESYGSTGVTR